jgi:iron complex outermembrane receptor protein
MVNSIIPISETTEVYAFGGRNYRDTNAYAFSRSSFADGDNRSVPSIYPNGFTPRITSIITDGSLSAGVKHELDNGWNLDFNNTFGVNKFHYFIKDSNNASLGSASPTDFDAGGHSLSQNTTGLDFSKYFENTAEGLNIAFGLEYRTENFQIFAGEEASYGLYDTNGIILTNPALQTVAKDSNNDDLPGGSQGFPGYSPDNEVDRSRTNIGLYFDTELNISESFLVSAAIRYEDYSDFGNTFNYKLASRYKVSDNLSFRGSVSSGFRAPSLAQIYYNLKFTNIVAGKSVPSLLSANNSTVTKAFGIGDLQEEKALNTSIGFTYKTGGFTATIDAYSISVDDRIILTDNFTDQTILAPLGVDAAQFFANGVDTKTSGVDIVLNYKTTIGEDHKLDLGLIGNLNKLEIKKVHNGSLNPYTFFSGFSQAYLEAAAPDYKFGLNLGYSHKKFNANVTLTQFSEVQLQDFQWVDSPPSTKAEADALYLSATDTYEATLTTDVSLGYELTDKIKLTVGANNLFNKYPTPQFDGWTDQGGLADSVQMGSDGAYYFTRVSFNF